MLVALDFDGTVAPIVDDPTTAAATADARRAIDDLLETRARVAVISGRPISFLVAAFPDLRVELAGLYGVQRRQGGVSWQHPSAARWKTAVSAAAAEVRVQLPDVRLEVKDDLACTLHWRETPWFEDEVRQCAARLAQRYDLELVAARSAVELLPPISAGKAAALADLARGEREVVYVGDDAADVSVMRWLAEARAAGRFASTLAAAVESTEAPSELYEAADALIAGPDGVGDFLREIASSRR